MASPGKIIMGVLVIAAFITIRAIPKIATEESYAQQAINTMYLSHPAFAIIAVMLGFGLIFMGLKM